MKNIPNKIYLQIGEPSDIKDCQDFKELEVTWCSDRINDNDLVYVRYGKAQSEANQEGYNEWVKDAVVKLEQLSKAEIEINGSHLIPKYNLDKLIELLKNGEQ